MSPTCRFVAALLMPAVLGAPLPADKDLDDQIARFHKAKAAADTKAAKAFEKTVHAAKSDPAIKEAARKEWIDKCVAAKAKFDETGRWPSDPTLGLDDDEWNYNREVGQAFGALSKVYDRQIKAARLEKNDLEVQILLAGKAKVVESAFPNRAAFAAGTVWTGTATGPKGGNVKMTVRVSEVGEATFEGVVVINPQIANHPEFEITGTIDGNELIFVKKKQIQGKGGAQQYVGYLSVGRMLLTYGAGGHVALEPAVTPKKKK